MAGVMRLQQYALCPNTRARGFNDQICVDMIVYLNPNAGRYTSSRCCLPSEGNNHRKARLGAAVAAAFACQLLSALAHLGLHASHHGLGQVVGGDVRRRRKPRLNTAKPSGSAPGSGLRPPTTGTRQVSLYRCLRRVASSGVAVASQKPEGFIPTAEGRFSLHDETEPGRVPPVPLRRATGQARPAPTTTAQCRNS